MKHSEAVTKYMDDMGITDIYHPEPDCEVEFRGRGCDICSHAGYPAGNGVYHVGYAYTTGDETFYEEPKDGEFLGLHICTSCLMWIANAEDEEME